MSANKKTTNYKAKKWLFFALSITAYFLPYIIVTVCLMPTMKTAEKSYSLTIGIVMILVNALPFVIGFFKRFLIHYPMFYGVIFAVLICAVGGLFSFDIFAKYTDKFLWIEFAVMCGGIASLILWHFYIKYKTSAASVKAIKNSGLFQLSTKE